jgi:hypothetical protein
MPERDMNHIPPTPGRPPRVVVVTCAVLELELGHHAAGVANVVGVEVLPQGLHNEPLRLREQLQQAIADVERRYPPAEAIVLGYGLCSRGVEGVTARRCRIVLPRAHDCITLLLGCRHRYAEYVRRHPGTYWYSPGWNKHHVPPGPDRYHKLLATYRERFGEDDAQFLMESEQHWFQTYDRATYVHLGVGNTAADVGYSRGCAEWLKWSFDQQQGDAGLLRTLLAGPWDDDRFLVLEPGQTARMTADDRVVCAVPARDAAGERQSGGGT